MSAAVVQADDSCEMSRLIFYEKCFLKEMSSAAVVIGTLRVKFACLAKYLG